MTRSVVLGRLARPQSSRTVECFVFYDNYYFHYILLVHAGCTEVAGLCKYCSNQLIQQHAACSIECDFSSPEIKIKMIFNLRCLFLSGISFKSDLGMKSFWDLFHPQFIKSNKVRKLLEYAAIITPCQIWCLQVPKTLTVQPVVITLTLNSMNINLFTSLRRTSDGRSCNNSLLIKTERNKQCLKKKQATLDRKVYVFLEKHSNGKTLAGFSNWLTGVTYYSWWGCFSEHQEKDSPQEADLVSTSFTLCVSLRILLSVLSTRWARSSMISEKKQEKRQRRIFVFEESWLCSFCLLL